MQQLISSLGANANFWNLILGDIRSFFISSPGAMDPLTLPSVGMLFMGMIFAKLDNLLRVDCEALHITTETLACILV